MRNDMAVIFRLIAYPKIKGNPPPQSHAVRYLASFGPLEFFAANKYVAKLRAADTSTSTRRIYLDDHGYLYHVEQDKQKEKLRA